MLKTRKLYSIDEVSAPPRIFRVRQKFESAVVQDVAAEVESQLASLNLGAKVQPGETVAITAGSRGIAKIDEITKAVVAHLKGLDAEPFLVPAMGSHGGATAERHRRIIESYGITEESCGCPIRASMDTVVVCEAVEGQGF